MKECVPCHSVTNYLTPELHLALTQLEKKSRKLDVMLYDCMRKPITTRKPIKKISFFNRIWAIGKR